MDCAEEVASRLVVTRGDGAVLLEAGKEVLDQMARLVQVAVIRTRLAAAAARWDHYGFAGLHQGLDHAGVGVIGAVGNDTARLAARQQRIGAFQIVCLAGRQM